MPRRPSRTVSLLDEDSIKSLLPTAERRWTRVEPTKWLHARAELRRGTNDWEKLEVRFREIWTDGGRNGSQKSIAVGVYPTNTLKQIAKASAKLEAQIALGDDPNAKRKDTLAELTVDQAWERYRAATTKGAATLVKNEITFNGHIARRFGTRKLSAVSREDVQVMYKEICSGKVRKSLTASEKRLRAAGKLDKGAGVWGGVGAAKKAVQLLSTLYNWTIDAELTKSNPAKGIKTAPDARYEGFLTSEDVGRLFEELDYQTKRRGAPAVCADVARLLLLTGRRKADILHLKHSSVHLDSNLLQLPDAKEGLAKVHLNPDAAAILTKYPKGGSAYVFPDPEHKNEPMRGHRFDHFWRVVRMKIGLPGFHAHGLRHTFASAAGASQLVSLANVSGMLGHKRLATTQRYVHFFDAAQAEATNLVAGIFAKALNKQDNES